MFKLYYSRENKQNYNYIAFTDIEGNDADEESHSINFYQCRISKKNNTTSYINLQDL